MDKAPDAFRTISEVAEELDIPQHVLRFWETRFTQIKPMKRSGGRRYYRPDDIGLLRGIRHLLYGEGYTIRGVQRILKEHGIKAVQALADGGSAAFAPMDRRSRHAADDEAVEDEALAEPAEEQDAEELLEDDAEAEHEEIAAPPIRREPVLGPPPSRMMPRAQPLEGGLDRLPAGRPSALAAGDGQRRLDRDKLQSVLADLVACRQLLDEAMKG